MNCMQCGYCCTNLSLTAGQLAKLPKAAQDILTAKGQFFPPLLWFFAGPCPLLTKQDGVAICRYYENRPDICRAFPIIQAADTKTKQYRLSIYSMNLNTQQGCPTWATMSPKDCHEATDIFGHRAAELLKEYDEAMEKVGPLAMAKMTMSFSTVAQKAYDLQNVPVILLSEYIKACKKGKNKMLGEKK